MNLSRRSIFGLFVFLFTCLFLALVFCLDCFFPIKNIVKNEIVVLPVNTSAFTLVKQFKQRHWVHSGLAVNAYLRLSGLDSHLYAGRYWLKPGMSVRDLLLNMSQSRGMVTYQFQIIPGATFFDILRRVKQSPDLNNNLKGLSAKDIRKLLRISYSSVEGLLAPNTYQYVYGNDASLIMNVSYKKMQVNLKRVWDKRAKYLPYKNSYQLLIAASLIEAEAKLDRERPLVSSVLVNRLRINMPLQFDSTVLYGLHQHLGGRLTRQDLVRLTPFNTYKVTGLPPTPIDNPGLASLRAAAHPAKTDYLYFVVDPWSKLGAHVFSRTLAGHEKAVKNYVSSLS